MPQVHVPGRRASRRAEPIESRSHAVPKVVLPQVPQTILRGPKKRGELIVQDPFDVGLPVKDEGVSILEKNKVRIPTELVPHTNFLWNHNLAFARHFHDMHRLVRRVLLLEPCPGRRECKRVRTLSISAVGADALGCIPRSTALALIGRRGVSDRRSADAWRTSGHAALTSRVSLFRVLRCARHMDPTPR